MFELLYVALDKTSLLNALNVNVERWQGPPHVHKVKQYKLRWIFEVSLCLQLIRSWKQREIVDLVCLGVQFLGLSGEK